MPSFTDNKAYPGWSENPVRFGLGDTIAPRIGLTYDVFGDSSLKLFASYGIYYDLMKLYMGQLTFGGTKRIETYYALQDPDWTKIAASGVLDDEASQKAGNTYAGYMDYLPPSLNRVDPDMKPTAQREISFGAEKKLWRGHLRLRPFRPEAPHPDDRGRRRLYLHDLLERGRVGFPGLLGLQSRLRRFPPRLRGRKIRPRLQLDSRDQRRRLLALPEGDEGLHRPQPLRWKSGSATTGRAGSTTP